MDLQQLLGGELGEQVTGLISNQLGIDQNQAQSAIGLALPTLLNALNKNASTDDGAAALTNAIAGKHNGADLADLAGLAQSALGGDGSSMLKHILGGAESNVTNAISQNTGIGGGQASQILQILGPVLLNALGNQSQATAGGINVSSIASLLSNFVGNHQQQAPQHQNIISSLLDQNNDGNVADDALKIGAGFLKNLFK